MMGTNPWDSRAGQYDRPSSGVPVRDVSARREAAPVRQPGEGYVAKRMADAAIKGIAATGTDTILARIDDAIARLAKDGHGHPRAIYLVDSDMMAFRAAHGAVEEYRDVRVSLGASSKVYGATGGARAVRRATK